MGRRAGQQGGGRAASDENLDEVHWTPRGIYAVAWQKTRRPLVHLDPASGAVSVVGTTPERIFEIDVSADGTELALLGQTASTLPEVYRTPLDAFDPQRVTAATDQLSDWTLGSSEVISWTSRDGTPIEGVLYTPADFDPSEQYPLLVNIHGGPAGIDSPKPLDAYVYPVAQWVAKGALVLQPNYRGSTGYGEAFRSLNVGALGVGDMKDVMSGVDHLVDRGIVDTTRMGAMGGSQGGYISAYLATNTDRFSAISVGAGISDWETYYATTDIPPFTRQYLGGTPWENPEIYETTSPMTTIQRASTPTPIQHGENDARVPIPNAYKLYQGLRDQEVPTELIVYEGFGHGITKPKERLAAMWHNWQWFARAPLGRRGRPSPRGVRPLRPAAGGSGRNVARGFASVESPVLVLRIPIHDAMLKHLPERYLPDPEQYLPGRWGRLEGTLVLAVGTVGLSLSAALFSGWFPTAAMASALSGTFPALLTFGTTACVSLWWGYVLWRSKALDEEWETRGIEWLWGWCVATPLLAGLIFLSVTVRLLLGVLAG